MDDESLDISARTRLRAADSINKEGYMNGASDGQDVAFQSSFNSGYAQGFNLAFNVGFDRAMSRINKMGLQLQTDSRNINYQICKNPFKEIK